MSGTDRSKNHDHYNQRGYPMIIISQTFATTTPESAEHGEHANTGFDWRDNEYTFRELVEYIRDAGFIHPSSSHGVPTWLTCEAYDSDLATGETTQHSIHPGTDRVSQRYWAKACKAAGINQ